jgi:hypothetical protein
MTDREIAKKVGVGHATVSRARKPVVSNETTEEKRTGKAALTTSQTEDAA